MCFNKIVLINDEYKITKDKLTKDKLFYFLPHSKGQLEPPKIL